MGKSQLTQLLNYQNYQNAIKVKTSTLSWIPFFTFSKKIPHKDIHISIYIKNLNKKNFLFFSIFSHFLGNQTV